MQLGITVHFPFKMLRAETLYGALPLQELSGQTLHQYYILFQAYSRFPAVKPWEYLKNTKTLMNTKTQNNRSENMI